MAGKKGTKAERPYRPYKSYVLVTGATASLGKSVVALVENVVAALDDSKDIRAASPAKTHGVQFRCVTYVLESDPSWHMGPTGAERDVIHHLVVVSVFKNLAAVCCSDAALREKVFREVRKGASGLSLVGDERIRAAFVAGKAKTLWLSGTHRRTTVKADSKVLAGEDLRDALNPLEDQSYYFTSARMETLLGGASTTVGVSPSGSRAWLSPSKDWADFCQATQKILKHLADAKGSAKSALPILARTTTSLSAVGGAFDIVLEAEDTVASPVTPGTDFAAQIGLAVASHKGAVIQVNARDKAGSLSDIELELKAVDQSGYVTSAVAFTAAPALDESRKALLGKLINAFEDGRRVKIYFDSGHTLADGRLVEVQFRDHPYLGYEWEKWGKYDVTKEKPSALSKIGKEDSLFDWAHKKWNSGYLCCDDGAGELADFLSFTPGPAPVIRLVHAKGAGSGAASRELSVTDYEVVVAQALKNLRWLERRNAAEKLDLVGNSVSDLVWKDGKTIKRATALNALKEIGASARFEICIVQPRLTKKRHDEVRNGSATPSRVRRLQRLDTLLNAADLAVRSLNATLKVYVDEG